jgi:hypothetical protein
MKRFAWLTAVVVLATGVASAQAMLEHSVAAAGGSAAGVAGKGVSTGLDKVFKKLDEASKSNPTAPVAKKTAKPQKTQADPPYVLPIAGPSSPPPFVAFPAKGSSSDDSKDAHSVTAGTPHRAVAKRPEPPGPKITVEDIAAITVGMRKEELYAKVGRPSSTMVIPDGDRLVEVMSYATRSQYLGSIRVDNGAVISVKVPR